RLLPQLVDADHETVGMVRSPEQFERIEEAGAEPRLVDLEGEFRSALQGADAVVFTAGSGGSTGGEKTLLIDLWGAKRAIDVCEEQGIDRFVMVSSVGADDPDASPQPIRHYLVAKHFADRYLRQSSLDATILRPGPLTDDEPQCCITAYVDESAEEPGEIPRGDVAAAIATCLKTDDTIGHTIEIFGGETPIPKALQAG
ncbi:MAG: SDR family oxidoreductase, partial [Bradymonadaceae bacterium]